MHFLRTIDILCNVKYIQFPRVVHTLSSIRRDNGRSLFKILFPRRVKWRMIYRLRRSTGAFYSPTRQPLREHRVLTAVHRYDRNIRAGKEYPPRERKGETPVSRRFDDLSRHAAQSGYVRPARRSSI